MLADTEKPVCCERLDRILSGLRAKTLSYFAPNTNIQDGLADGFGFHHCSSAGLSSLDGALAGSKRLRRSDTISEIMAVGLQCVGSSTESKQQSDPDFLTCT